jgi:CheY-like chemotaxis protein
MPRILIVDDNEDNRDVMARRLARRGFDVEMSASGKAALDDAISAPPDLILMDMNMPEMDGWEATRKLREQGITTPIIAITAHAMTGDRERAIEAGCTEYHAKPVEMDRLLSLIDQLLDSTTGNTAIE